MTKHPARRQAGLIPSLVTSNAQRKTKLQKKKKKISSIVALTYNSAYAITNALYDIKKRKKNKTTSNMRSQNEVIQVQCVEIKLKKSQGSKLKQREETCGRPSAGGQTVEELIYPCCTT